MAEITTRQQIVLEADKFFYQRGYDHTSFADIANAVGISRGNFYHHFKTKDEILSAVISMRLEHTKEKLHQWEREANSPLERLKSFVSMITKNQSKIMRHGCPVGSLCMELVKLNHDSQQHANELFFLFKDWLCQQFQLLGHKSNADILAMHLLARSQGIAVLASSIADQKFIQYEVDMLYEWVNQYA